MGVRSEFAEALKPLLGGVEVIDHARNLDSLAAPVVMLERTQVAKASNALGAYLTTWVIHVISPVQGRDTAEDALDDSLDTLLVALDQIQWCHWEQATRSRFQETWPGFAVEVQTITAKAEGV